MIKQRKLIFAILCLCLVYFVISGYFDRESSPSHHRDSYRRSTSSVPPPTTIAPFPKDCSQLPSELVGNVTVSTDVKSFEEIEEANKNVRLGGHFIPDCNTEHKAMILIAYRNREKHLKIFLNHMHPILQRQKIDYQIFLIEPQRNVRFNRALLMNIGFVEAMKLYDFRCVFIHDIDLLMENDHNLYTCPRMPRQMSMYVDKWSYRVPYEKYFGGISAMPTRNFTKVNGMSNIYFGWGGEDDDLYRRVTDAGLSVERHPEPVSHLKTLSHTIDKGNEFNENGKTLVANGLVRQPYDGLNSLTYTLERVVRRKLYTKFKVRYDEKETREAIEETRRKLFKKDYQSDDLLLKSIM